MPAHRTKPSSRRGAADAQQLVWTMPVEPASTGGIAFAANITPVTFNEPPSCASPFAPAESFLFPSSDPNSSSTPRRPGHAKKKPANHIPRPPNAFILFRSAFIKSQHVSTEVETNHSTLSKIIGLTWQNLPEGERQIWHLKAKAALDEHKRKFPQYAFRPLHAKEKGTEKRKVREVGPKDLKRCAKIAELLVEGLKGQELEEAIQEFDKYHVPEIVTRFEAPITANMYRGSSSASGTDDEDEQQHKLSKRKHRSTSRRQGSPTTTESTPPPSPGFEEAQIQSSDDYPELVPVPDSYESSQREATFDFNAFSFDNITSSGVPFTYDALSDDGSINFNDMYGCTVDGTQRPSLSINTSFATTDDSWTRPASPLSSSSIPATPYYAESPTADGFTPYTPISGSFDDLSGYPVYNNCSSDFTPCQAPVLSGSIDFASLSFEQTHCASGANLIASAYLDFSTLAAMPHHQYPL